MSMLERLKGMDADFKRMADAMTWERPEESTTAQELADELGIKRHAASEKLNRLWKAGKLAKRKFEQSMVYYPVEDDDGNGEVYDG